jgi:hypothetical protein
MTLHRCEITPNDDSTQFVASCIGCYWSDKPRVLTSQSRVMAFLHLVDVQVESLNDGG